LRRIARLLPALVGLTCAIAIGACSPGPSPSPPAPPGRATFDALFASRQLTGFAIAPSGESVLYSLTGPGGNELIERNLARTEVRALPLSPSPWPWRLHSLSPRGREALLVGGAPGDDCRAPLAVRREDGRLLRVDPGDERCASFLGWLRDGEGVLLASDEANPGGAAAVEVALASGLRLVRFAADEPWRLGPLSRDGRRLFLSRPGPDPPAALAFVELASGELASLPLPEGRGEGLRIAPRAVSADGRHLFALLEGGGRRGIARLDLAAGRWENLPLPCPAPERLLPSPTGRFLGVDCGAGPHRLLAAAPEEESGWRSAEVPLPEGVALWALAFRGDDGTAVAAAGSESWPLDLFVWEPGSARSLQLTYHLGPRVDPADLGPSSPIPTPHGGTASLFAARSGSPPAGGVVWADDSWPGDDRAAPPFHPLAHWLAGQGIPVLRFRAAPSPFGDPAAPPDFEALARQFAAHIGGGRPTGIVGIGRQAAWAGLDARGSWRAVVAIAPGPPPLEEAEELLPGERQATVPGLPRLPVGVPQRSLLLGLRDGDTGLPEPLRAALVTAGAAPGPAGAYAPDSPADLDLWRAAARLLRAEARP